MSRICHHRLSQAVYETGTMNWQGNVILSKDCTNKLLFFRHNIVNLNGHPIQKSRTANIIMVEKAKQKYFSDINEDDFNAVSTMVSEALDHFYI